MREAREARRLRGGDRRGLSGLGILLVVIGLVVLAVNLSKLPALVYSLWPLILVAVGLFGLFRRPGWVRELDFWGGPEAGRFFLRPQRIFSVWLVIVGLVALLFTLHLVDSRVLGPGILILLGLLLLWRRSR